MKKMIKYYSATIFIIGLFTILMIVAGSHGHFSLQNKEASDASKIFMIFTATAIINLMKSEVNFAWQIGRVIANLIAVVTLVKILLFIIDFNINKGEFPILFPIVVVALTLFGAWMILDICISIIRVSNKRTIDH
jgi:hypothetical protein